MAFFNFDNFKKHHTIGDYSSTEKYCFNIGLNNSAGKKKFEKLKLEPKNSGSEDGETTKKTKELANTDEKIQLRFMQ